MSKQRRPPSRRSRPTNPTPQTQIDSRIKPPEFVYHYTDREGIQGILRDGLIRASPTTLYADFLMTTIARITNPVVWLSINPVMEGTTFVKFGALVGVDPIGNIHRVTIPYGYAGDLGLGEYTEREQIPEIDWLWNIRTGELAGSNYSTWRLVPHDIPRSAWIRVEQLIGLSGTRTEWEAVDG